MNTKKSSLTLDLDQKKTREKNEKRKERSDSCSTVCSQVSISSESSDISKKLDLSPKTCKNKNVKGNRLTSQACTSKSLSSQIIDEYSKNDFCLIQWVVDKRFSVVKLIEVCDPKNVKCGKSYSVKYEKQYLMAIVKFIGTRKACEEQLNTISTYSVETNEVAKSKKVKTSVAQIQELVESIGNNDQPSFYLSKIKELESALVKKNEECESLKDQVKQKSDIINCYKRTYDEDKVNKILEFSVNFIKLNADRVDLAGIPLYNDDNRETFTLSQSYPQVTLQREFKIEIDSFINNPLESDTSVYRKLIGSLIPSDEIWALRDREQMKIDYREEIHASYQYVFNKRQNLTFRAAENEIRKLCNEARKRLRDTGLEILKSNESETTAYVIADKSKIFSEAKKRKILDESTEDEEL
ncbi:unnamed protein product [Brachionus calyciflorus]|uniref:Uncharacterized protein n=1 Tax=Brachionus calyciflorus TaxID=104777 RepID=A0A814JVN5_9BILA|nr:unnamed protein product [Brachionus calyciflorus]